MKRQYWIGRVEGNEVRQVVDYSGPVAVDSYPTREAAEKALPMVEAADREHTAQMVAEGWIPQPRHTARYVVQ